MSAFCDYYNITDEQTKKEIIENNIKKGVSAKAGIPFICMFWAGTICLYITHDFTIF